MRLFHGALSAVLALALLGIPSLVVFAQDTPLIVRGDPQFGRILTDANGMTVYTWQGDEWGTGISNCYEACATSWPPVPADEQQAMSLMPAMSGDEMMMMPNPEGVGVLQRSDMTYQMTYNGYPLYYFVRDTAPGDKNGQGSQGFGATWAVVVPNEADMP